MNSNEKIEKQIEIRQKADILLAIDVSANGNGILLFQSPDGKFRTNKIVRMDGIIKNQNSISENVASKIFDICRTKDHNREDIF